MPEIWHFYLQGGWANPKFEVQGSWVQLFEVPRNLNFEINFTNLKKDGGESDARDLASELFLAGKTPEEENMKDSSLNGSLESLEHDQQQHDRQEDFYSQ